MGNPMRTITFKIPEDLDETLTQLADRRQSSRSALLREALEAFAQQHRQSVTQRLGHLVGCFDGGPRDLASNPKHMAGYGK